METRDFKKLFGEVAKTHGFHAAHGGWYRELPAALFVMDLQKSNYGNYFELNLKLFLERVAPKDVVGFKKLLIQSGDVFRRQPKESSDAFDLNAPIATAVRRAMLDEMFCDLVDRMVRSASTAAGILELRDEGLIYLLPMVEARLKTN